MSASLHSTTNFPSPTRAAAGAYAQAAGFWLLTAFLFLLLIVGRLASHSAPGIAPKQQPADAMSLPRHLPAYPVSGQKEPTPFAQPLVFHPLRFAAAAQ